MVFGSSDSNAGPRILVDGSVEIQIIRKLIACVPDEQLNLGFGLLISSPHDPSADVALITGNQFGDLLFISYE